MEAACIADAFGCQCGDKATSCLMKVGASCVQRLASSKYEFNCNVE